MGRATRSREKLSKKILISIHALRGEGDNVIRINFYTRIISIHALRGEGDLQQQNQQELNIISIHALRGEGDSYTNSTSDRNKQISIHALRGEGDRKAVKFLRKERNFNPRPPWGGRRVQRSPRKADTRISIHALRGEGDNHSERPLLVDFRFQSTPSVGRATFNIHYLLLIARFQSTPSVGRATRRNPQYTLRRSRHFNPRPPWGGRLLCALKR